MIVLVKTGLLTEKDIQHPGSDCDGKPGHAEKWTLQILVMYHIDGRLRPIDWQIEVIGKAPANEGPADPKECAGPVCCHGVPAPFHL